MLVLRGHRTAAAVAVVVGVATAVGVTASHFVPQWSAFSDAFTGSEVAPGVNAFSWLTALFEIAAAVAFGVVGLRVLRSAGASPGRGP